MKNWLKIICIAILFVSCDDVGIEGYTPYAPTPQPLNIPQIFSDNILPPVIPIDNPQTVEGVALGRKLFYDTILSGDNTQSCASCHSPENAFTDSDRFSIGIDGLLGNRNSMPLFNMAWNYNEKFFWDGRSFAIEGQALEPVENPIEMHNTWENAVISLQNHTDYPNLFFEAFGTTTIDKNLITKAIAQFERTLISANSRFDKHLLGQITLTVSELNGFNVFMDETKGDCFHCHGNANNPLWTDNIFHNNGLDTTFSDIGLGEFTGNPADNGKFKSPSLRNLKYTAPYMHDGRFETLDEVLDFYSSGVQQSPSLDPLMEFSAQGGVSMNTQEKADLKAFLLLLNDETFLTNEKFSNPF